jgi:probable HAF family extracellular repeat protein
MKLTYHLKARSFVVVAALGMGFSVALPAFGQDLLGPDYLIGANGKVLASFGESFCCGRTSLAGINDAGQVAGSASTGNMDFRGASHAFRSGPNGVGQADLGTLDRPDRTSGASDINNAGQVVGWSQLGGSIAAFIAGPDATSMTGIYPPGASDSQATGINDTGQAVGTFGTGDGGSLAFVTGPNGTNIATLGTLGGKSAGASDINNAGQVVGSSTTTAGDTHAFITGPNGVGLRDLGTLGGSSSFASGINVIGQVVGSSTTTTGDSHAFITGPNGVGMIDLGTLGGNNSSASGINDAGQVVGQSDVIGGQAHAFITGPDGVGMTDLNSLVSLPGGLYLTRAGGINNPGQIIATSAIPEPASYALMLSGLGLIGFMASRSKPNRLPGECI